MAPLEACSTASGQCSSPGIGKTIDLLAWRDELQQFPAILAQVVQRFVDSQCKQLERVAEEFESQKLQAAQKERDFTELSDSIANFVESEAARLDTLGICLFDTKVDAEREAYDAELPGPPALHRINRLWRKATCAIEVARDSREREVALMHEEQERRLHECRAEVEKHVFVAQAAREEESATFRQKVNALQEENAQIEASAHNLRQEIEKLDGQLSTAKADIEEKSYKIQELNTSRGRSEYEWCAEREEYQRERDNLKITVQELHGAISKARERESELERTCDERAAKLMEMRRIMDEQERDMTAKIERVQNYVKERQTGAIFAERKQQDAERMADRWQKEVVRLQTERDDLAQRILELESRQIGQVKENQGAHSQHMNEVSALKEAFRKREDEMRQANEELLRKREDEYQVKMNLERQREKERSIALVNKKQQEVQIKDQQLRALRSRMQELEVTHGEGVGSTPPPLQPSPRGSRRGVSASYAEPAGLPPLPLSAR